MPWPIIAGVAGAGLGALAAHLGRKEQNKLQMQLAREQMQFQERMSSTAWQRAVKDMKLAGINPMLAFMQGGASSPGGQMAQVQDVLGPAVSSAMAGLRLRQDLKNLEAQRKSTMMDLSVKSAQMYKLMAEANKIRVADPQSGKPYYHQTARLERDILTLQRRLLRLSVPAAGVKGTKAAGIIQTLWGRPLGPISFPRR